jgi:hypothetical protein
MTNIAVAPISAVAARMRRHRQRRRDGLRCVMVQLRESEIDELIRRGLLPEDHRNNPGDVTEAIHKHFDESLSSPRARNT